MAGSHALDDRWGLFAEVAGTATPTRTDPLILTAGVTRTLMPHLVLDAGVIVGLNQDAPDAQFLVGLTTNFGPLIR